MKPSCKLLMVMGCGLFLSLACARSERPAEDTNKEASYAVPVEGGSYTQTGLKVDIPEGALEYPLDITIRRIPQSEAPEMRLVGGAQIHALGDLWEFGPAGTTFRVPILIALSYTPDPARTPHFYWTLPDGTGVFEELPKAVFSDGQAVAEVSHFSRGVVGYVDEELDGDNEADGETNNETPCAADLDCSGGAVCIGGFCQIPPLFPQSMAWVSHLAFPSDFGLTNYGFDLNGDGKIDNRTASLMNLIWSLAGVPDYNGYTSSLWQSIRQDMFTTLLAFDELPQEAGGPVRFRFLNGRNDLNYDGEPDQSELERYNGHGLFRVSRKSLWDSAVVPDFKGDLADNVLTARSKAPWRLLFPFESENELQLSFDLYDIRMKAKVRREGTRLFTEDVDHSTEQTTDAEANSDVEGGAMLGGVVSIASLLDSFNGIASLCSCAGVDPSKPLVEYHRRGGKFSAVCTQHMSKSVDLCVGNTTSSACYYLSTLCDVVPMLKNFADFSTGIPGDDGRPALDAISTAFAMSFRAASLADPPIAAPFLARNDWFSLNNDQSIITLPVLSNDEDGIHERPRIASVTAPSKGGTLRISDDGAFLYYKPPINWFFSESFSYTLLGQAESGATNTTAKVTIDLYRDDFRMGSPTKDEFSIPINRGWQELDVIANDDFDSESKKHYKIESITFCPRGRAVPSADRYFIRYLPPADAKPGETVTIRYEQNCGTTIWGEVQLTLHFTEPQTRCGDSWVDSWADESCDDGGAISGDGCDAACHLEACDDSSWQELMWYDKDGDGYGDPRFPAYYCGTPPAGVVDNASDCDDTRKDVHPGAAEETPGAGNCADGLDNNCNGVTDCAELACYLDAPSCRELDCADGIDNDEDGVYDCGDHDCYSSMACAYTSRAMSFLK